LYRKQKLFSKIIFNSFKIAFRFLKLLFNRKKLSCTNFRPDSSYCIEGSLNQLLWDVENAVFVTLSNSSQIFFDSSQFLFNVKKEQSQFQLIAYGVGHSKKLSTKVKIISLEKFDFNHVVTQTKSIVVDYQKTIKSSNISLKHVPNHSISFQKSLMPKEFKKIQIDINRIDFINNCSAELLKTNSIQEVNNLKETIENNIDNT